MDSPNSPVVVNLQISHISQTRITITPRRGLRASAMDKKETRVNPTPDARRSTFSRTQRNYVEDRSSYSTAARLPPARQPHRRHTTHPDGRDINESEKRGPWNPEYFSTIDGPKSQTRGSSRVLSDGHRSTTSYIGRGRLLHDSPSRHGSSGYEDPYRFAHTRDSITGKTLVKYTGLCGDQIEEDWDSRTLVPEDSISNVSSRGPRGSGKSRNGSYRDRPGDRYGGGSYAGSHTYYDDGVSAIEGDMEYDDVGGYYTVVRKPRWIS